MLSNSKIYNSNDILKVWYWTVEETALKNIIGCSAVYDRHAEISETGTRVDCTTSGQDCNVGNITSLNLSQQISIFDNYYNNGNIKKYFLNEKWTLLFPNLNDNWLNSILMNEYKFIKLENSNTIRLIGLAYNKSNIGAPKTGLLFSKKRDSTTFLLLKRLCPFQPIRV